jgi:hypothetical protein
LISVLYRPCVSCRTEYILSACLLWSGVCHFLSFPVASAVFADGYAGMFAQATMSRRTRTE